MSLSLTYNNSHGSHIRPGATLKGVVHFSSKTDSAISKCTITFSGRCKVKIREHIHYTTRTFRSRGYYFHLSQEVFDGGGFTHKAGDYAWPFEFKVPTEAAPQHDVAIPKRPGLKGNRVLDHNGIMQVVNADEEGEDRYDNFPFKKPWRGGRDLRTHPLPDSMKVAESKWPVEWEGRVEYALIAKAERPSQGGSKLFASVMRAQDLEAVVDVDLKNRLHGLEKKMLKQTQTMTFERVLGDGTKSKPVLGRALSKLTKTKSDANQKQDGKPGQRIFFVIQTANAAQAQSTLPFVVKAAMTFDTDAPAQYQAIHIARITDISISLLRKASVRDDSSAATEHTALKVEKDVLCWRRGQKNIDIVLKPPLAVESYLNEKWEQKSSTAQYDQAATGKSFSRPAEVPSTAEWTGQADLEDLIHLPSTTPSFSTYNIALAHTVEFEITISILGDTVVLSSQTEGNLPIDVVPAIPTINDNDAVQDFSDLNINGKTRGTDAKRAIDLQTARSQQDVKHPIQGGLSTTGVMSKDEEAAMEREAATSSRNLNASQQRRRLPSGVEDEDLPAYEPKDEALPGFEPRNDV